MHPPSQLWQCGTSSKTTITEHAWPRAELVNSVLVSAGFDSREGDTLGRFSFSDEGYRRMTRVVASIAARHCGGRLVSLLEGGYNLGGLASAAHAHVWALTEAALAMPEPRR